METKKRTGFDHVMTTPMGILYGLASLALMLGLPFQAAAAAPDPQLRMQAAVVGFVAGAMMSLLLGIFVYLYVKLGKLIAVIQIILALPALLESQSIGTPHLRLWCDVAQFIGIHHPALEWGCAAIAVFGWIQLVE